MAHAGAGLAEPVNVQFVEPDAVTKRHLRSEQAKAVDILDRAAAAAPPRVFLLVGRLQQVHVQRHAVFARGVGKPPERVVGAPVQIGRGELDLDPTLVVVPAVQPLEQRDAIIERELEAVVPALRRPAQLGRQAGDKILVALIDEPVLVAHRKGIGDPHPDILVGADRLVGASVDLGELAGNPALQVLHRRDARRDHLEGGIERVEIEVEVARHHAGDKPQLQGHVRRAKLHRA